MSGPTMSMRIEGLSELEAALVELGDSVAVPVLRAVGRRSMQPMLDDARRYAEASKDRGALQEALGLAVTGYGKRLSLADALVTVRLRIKSTSRSDRRKKYGHRSKYVPNPRRYWHLVEWGTRRSRAKPFIRPALDANERLALESVRDGLRQRIDRVKKRRAKGKT